MKKKTSPTVGSLQLQRLVVVLKKGSRYECNESITDFSAVLRTQSLGPKISSTFLMVLSIALGA
jgi:hypothetical protein